MLTPTERKRLQPWLPLVRDWLFISVLAERQAAEEVARRERRLRGLRRK